MMPRHPFVCPHRVPSHPPSTFPSPPVSPRVPCQSPSTSPSPPVSPRVPFPRGTPRLPYGATPDSPPDPSRLRVPALTPPCAPSPGVAGVAPRPRSPCGGRSAGSWTRGAPSAASASGGTWSAGAASRSSLASPCTHNWPSSSSTGQQWGLKTHQNQQKPASGGKKNPGFLPALLCLPVQVQLARLHLERR